MVGRYRSIAPCAVASMDGDKGEIGTGQTAGVVRMDHKGAVTEERRRSALG